MKRDNRTYAGILGEIGGERLGKGGIIVPLDSYIKIQKLFRDNNLKVKIKSLIEYAR